jgi:hypothetical protein
MPRKSSTEPFPPWISCIGLIPYLLFATLRGGFFMSGPLNPTPTPAPSPPSPLTGQELLAFGSVHTSPGGQYSFRVLGPCCRLFDREELPWPCCRLAWRSKEPSWRRIGRRFVADLAARRCPSYAVELLQPGARPTATVITLFPVRLSPVLQEWWYSRNPASCHPANRHPLAPD